MSSDDWFNNWVEQKCTCVTEWVVCPTTGGSTRTYVDPEGRTVRQYGKLTQVQDNRLFIACNPDLDPVAVETLLRNAGLWD